MVVGLCHHTGPMAHSREDRMNETESMPARRSVGDSMIIIETPTGFRVRTGRDAVIVDRVEMEEHATFVLAGALDTIADDMAATLRELSKRCERLTQERDDALADRDEYAARLHEAERRHRRQIDGLALAASAGGDPC